MNIITHTASAPAKNQYRVRLGTRFGRGEHGTGYPQYHCVDGGGLYFVAREFGDHWRIYQSTHQGDYEYRIHTRYNACDRY